MRVGGIVEIKNNDARQVLVIGRQDPNDVPSNFLFVRTIGERDAIITNKIVVVRQAYLGDPTVVKGWAAYVLDKTTEPYKWMKLIEQESVDGPWGINEEIKQNLVTKSTFIQQINAIIERLNDIGDVSTVIDQAHTHTNKKQLDLISNIGDILTPTPNKKFSVALTVNGKLANDTYYYECFVPEEGTTIPASLAWMNPIDGGTYTPVSSSADIANRFASSESCMRIIFHGCKLAVRELDGTLSLYTFNQLSSSSYNAEFIGSLCGEADTRKAITFVDALPTPSETVSHGYYCVPALNAYFECIQSNGTWMWNELGLGVATGVQANIVACFRANWNNCTIVFKPKSDQVEVFETTVVRKFHSPSSSINDGVKVATVKGGSGAVTDVCPVSDTEVYYTVFQRLMDGSITEPVSRQADYLGWDDVATIISSGLFSSTFKDGDTVTLEHDVFGAIPCVVRDSSVNGCTLVATKSIINLEFDGSEHGYVKTTDTTYQSGKVYYTFEVSDADGVHKEQYVNIPNPEAGTNITGAVFEATDNTNAAYDNTNKVRHGNRNWSSSNLQQWLTSDEADGDHTWFTARDQFDVLGGSYEATSKTKNGFLAGFTDENLRDLIRNVRIPSGDVEVYTSDYVWTSVTNGDYDLKVIKKTNDGHVTGSTPPEGSDRIWNGTSSYTATLYGVAPVFEIALPEVIVS